MYLAQRFFALLIYVTILFSICVFIKKCRRQDIKIILFIYWILIGVMAFNYTPLDSADLTRLIPIMHGYAKLSISELIELVALWKSTTPGVIIYYHVIGQLGNDGWLPAITALIIYGIFFRILYDCFKRGQFSTSTLSCVLLLFMSRGLFTIMIGNIRTGISIAIVAWCVYREMCTSKSIVRDIPWYLIAVLMHTMGQLLVVLRFSFYLVESSENGKYKILKTLTAILLFISIVIFGIKFGFLDKLADKTEYYVGGSQNGTGYFYIWEFIFNLFFLLISVYCLRLRKTLESKTLSIGVNNNDRRMSSFFRALIVVDFILIFLDYNFYYRLGWFIAFIAAPMTMVTLGNCEKTTFYTKYRKNIIFFSIILLLLECIRGDLCGLRFGI